MELQRTDPLGGVEAGIGCLAARGVICRASRRVSCFSYSVMAE